MCWHFDSCFSHTKLLNMQRICQHSRQTTAHRVWRSPYTDTDCCRHPLCWFIPPLCVGMCMRLRKQSQEQRLLYRVCVRVLLLLPPKLPWLMCLARCCNPPPWWHCYDITATPDPQPDLIPVSQSGRGMEEGRKCRKIDSGGKVLHNIQVILQHLECINTESL